MSRNVIREIRNQVRYASLDFLIEKGVGSNADEVCKNLVGKVDEIYIDNDNTEEPYSDLRRVRIINARVEHNPTSMYPYYVNVDAEEV